MKNPFKYGARVSSGAFFVREWIMRDMLGVIDGGNNIVIKNLLSLFDDGYRDRHALPSTSTVNTALKRLIKESVVESQGGVHSLADPLLAYHLSRR